MAIRTTSRGQRRGMAKRILVAEDDPDNRCIVVKVLTREGYETLEADDGRSALALARRLKADPQTADIPIIAHRVRPAGR